jgi:hypothetical protein
LPIIPPAPPAPSTTSSTRIANDLMVEISGHLVEDIVNTTLTEPAIASATATLAVASNLAMYPGAEIIISNPDGSNPTLLTVLTVTPTGGPSPGTITASLLSSYPTASTLLGATFPTQQPSDPLFTQAEILSYLARAQNEFLSKVPCILQFTSQNIALGEEYQALPATAIELERVSINGTRLYEVSQSQLTMENPQWQWTSPSPAPGMWFEDRAGYYGWGVAPIPQAEFTCELLTSQRGPDSLLLTDFFLVPDPLIHFVKYKALEYIWSKDGEQRSPTMMRIARARFDSGVAISTRFMLGVVDAAGK